MGGILGELLPLALGVAISPVPIIAVILMLIAPRAGSTSLGFLIGWLAGIVVSVVVFLLLAGLLGDGTQDGPSTAVSGIKLVLGVLFLVLAVGQWRGRPKPGVDPELPGWMKAIDSFTPGRAAGLGFLLSGINPKNLAMAIAAGVAIGGAGLPGGQQVVAVIVYVVIAASTVAVPVIAYAVAADRIRGQLDELKSWLEANSATVMAVLLLVIGFVVFGNGLGGLI
jgi:hypothetical protein